MAEADKQDIINRIDTLFGVYVDHVDSRFDAITEYVQQIPSMQVQLGRVESQLNGIEEQQHLMRLAQAEDAGDVVQLKALHPGMKHT